MKKIIAILLAALLACMTVSALAAGQVEATASVNLRTGPGLAYDKIDAVKKGTTLEYLGETSTDDRGIDWYRVSYEGQSLWISSRYSKLEVEEITAVTDEDAGEYTEVSEFYLSELTAAAQMLGLAYHQETGSEVPNQYTDGSVTLAGNDDVESIVLLGAGYKLFGVYVGMDADSAKALMLDAGMELFGENGAITFERPVEGPGIDGEGHDSCITLEMDADGLVTSVDWSTYTG